MISFGLVVPAGPQKGAIEQWVTNLDAIVPQLQSYIDSLWMTDHFVWDDNPTYEAWTVISYLATRFPEFKVGSIVLGQGYRNPALLAKMASTLQMLSQGRLILGIGAGWKEDEYHAYGYDFPSPKIRVEQLDDTLEILTRLWTNVGKISYAGKHYHIQDAYCEPKPNPPIRLLVGGGGKKTMLLAARFADEWNMPDTSTEIYKTRRDILKQHCQDIGRDFSEIKLSWFGRISIAKTEAEALARSDNRWNTSNALVGTAPQVIEQIQAFVDIGVTGFMVEILDIDDAWVMKTIQNDVFSKLDISQKNTK